MKKLDNNEQEESAVVIIDKNNTKKIVYITGEINKNVSCQLIPDILNTNWKNKTLELYITSQGGFLSECFSIIDILRDIKNKYKVKIITHGLGEVASAGFFIFIFGDERIIHPSCRVFVHTHITVDEGKTYGERIKADKTEEKYIYENYIDYTSKQLGLSLTKTKTLLNKNKWLSMKEIENYNISTRS